MKKIIDGRKYDTETAKLICSFEYSNSSNFNWVKEELYQKRTGEFFIYGQGGANTIYAESNGNSSWGASRIEPITEAKARDFVEKNGSVEDYESIFGEVEE